MMMTRGVAQNEGKKKNTGKEKHMHVHPRHISELFALL
jgi:hypothetical protein